MRTISDTLEKAQQAGALNPLYKVVLTKGESSYTYEKDRILPSEHDEAIYSHRAKIVLSNHDHEFDDKNLKGYDAVISYGFAGEYSATCPLSVIDQQFDSDPNKLTCTLELEGMPNLMAKDEASESYLPDSDDTKTVKILVDAIAGATLDCFSHCHAFEVVWDDGYDSLADSYKPKDSLRIYSGNSRLAILRRVLDFTANVPRFEADGKIHIMKPVTSGDTFDSEYSLQQGQHQFFSKAYRETLVFPNRIVVRSQPDDDPQYSGEAQVDGYDSLPAKVKKTKYVHVRLESNDQAEDMAEALIAKAETGAARGQAEIRINVGAEVFDYDKVTDSRQGDTRTGNLGYIHRRFGKDKWIMTFGFGNWFDALRYQKMLKELETYTDAGQYFSRLSVGNLYAEHILADNMDFVWIDPDNTIDLSKIGDTFDNLPEGETYYRARNMHLDGETGLTLWEGMKYYVRFSPDSDEAGIRRQDTAPSGVETGEYWIDTSGAEPIIKRWTGSAWFTIEQAEIDTLNKGLLTTHTKQTSLSPDGFILLDEVQVGDLYGLVNKTAISQGKIKLSTEGIDDSLGYGLIKTVDIYNGHIKGTAIIQSSSARLVTDSEKDDWDDTYYIALDAYDLATEVEDDIVAGKLTLSAYTDIEGTWYKTGGVKLNASSGIVIYGKNKALVTRASEYGTDQCYVGSDGAIYAGGGNVKLDSAGIKIKQSNLKFYYSFASPMTGIIGGFSNYLGIYSDNNNDLKVDSDHNLYLNADGNVFMNPGSSSYVEILSGMRIYGEYMNLPKKSSNPSAVKGRLYYDTTKDLICYYRSGVGWRILQDNPY